MRARTKLVHAAVAISMVGPAAVAQNAPRQGDIEVPARLPSGVIPGGECPDPGPTADAEIAEQAAATIPLVEGLTLVHAWKRAEGEPEHEGLTQVTAVDARGVTVSISYPSFEGGGGRSVRRICRTDLRDAFSYLTAGHSRFPETFVGTVLFSLSRQSFLALKNNGSARHRYVYVQTNREGPSLSGWELDGTLANEGSSTFSLIVNDRTLDIPVYEATRRSREDRHLIRLQVLDDERFPLVVDYYIPSMGRFFVKYLKVSFPTAGGLERQLATDSRVDVYGIYFDFGSDVLRQESDPVLREIAAALMQNPDWKLSIAGHTDNVGGDASNLDLSRRRSEAVRSALADRFGIDAARLSTTGYGASQPKESNDTPEGRAKNRRVELVRS